VVDGAGPGDGEWCFVHAADLHLDTPFSGIARLDDDLAGRLRDASLEAFDALVDLTLERNAAVLLLAGDVYDGADRGVRAQLRMLRGLQRLSDAGIRTCIVAGNHDPLDGWTAIESWPDLVTEFGPDEPGIVQVERDGDLLAVVTGISYGQQAETRNLATMLARTDHDVPHVGLLHANVGSNPDHAPYAPCSIDDLRRGAMDYWALGHIHRREIVLDGTDGGPWAVYPGNLQGRSPKPSERGSKGASVVHVRGGRIVEVEHVALDRARFDEVAVEIGPDDDLGAVHRRLADGAREAAAEADGRILVLRGVITGRGDVHADLVRPDAVDDLLQALADEAPANPPTAWTALRVRTAPPRDPADAQAAEGLLADLATVVNDAMADPDAWADGPLEAAATVRATPVDPDDEPWDLRVDDDLIARAAALAAAQLERDPS
jgi:DNA repair protein SbcD/Mre11